MNTHFIIMIIISISSNMSCKPRTRRATGSSGQPLVLTPMIEKGDIQHAQELCKVDSLKGNITSYSGFLTVNTTSNIFFWFFPASMDDTTAPVINWHFGGAGYSSLHSIFAEIGPYEIAEDLSLKLRGPSVTKHFSVVYIDVPVGAGFSFTNDDKGYSTNYEEVAGDLYGFLVQFFTLFPKYQPNDFFFVGESYGGKTVTTVSNMIHKKNPSADVKINLRGLAIGNGLLDPKDMMHYGDYLYQIGLIDRDGLESFHKAEKEVVGLIEAKQYSEAYMAFDRIMTGFFTKPFLFHKLTGYENVNNFLYTSGKGRDSVLNKEVPQFLTQPNTRKAIHVGDSPYNLRSIKARDHLRGDLVTSVKPHFEALLENYRVLLYGGQLGMFLPYPLTEEFVAVLKWSRAAEFNAAPRTQWYIGEDLAGYSKEGGNLNLVLVRDAGHYTPMDQPEWSLDMITRFIRNERFSKTSA